jgi:hypothetical protein
MPALGADFGIILAYLVPGYITLWAISSLSKPIANLFQTAAEGEKRALAVFALTIVSLGTGMFVSILRAGTLDKSFELKVPFCASPQWGSVPRADPDFVALMCTGHRESFLLAEASDKRPYQFYGNMALAITIATAVAVLKMRKAFSPVGRGRYVLVMVAWAIMLVTFYSGARLSHYRFMKAVREINCVPCLPPT